MTVPYNRSEQVLLVFGADRNEIISGTGVIKGFQTKFLSIWLVIHVVTLLCRYGCRELPWLFQLAKPIIHITNLRHAFARSRSVLQGTIWQMVAMVWVLRR